MDKTTVTLTVGMLIGTTWHNKGDSVQLPEGRAKTLLKRKAAVAGEQDVRTSTDDDQPNESNDDDQPNEPNDDSTNQSNTGTSGPNETPLSETSIDPDHIKLLSKNGIETVEQLNAVEDLTKLKGIGTATAEKIEAALSD